MDKGAHFHRCDLQVHTPRDQNWTGGGAVADDQRQSYANQLVQACRLRGLQGIAITDHHDMVFVEYIRCAADEETDERGTPLPKQERLVVFPGMELTLGVPCQALLIFDTDFPADLFSLAMTALAINPSPNGDAKTANVERLQNIHSLKQLKDKLDERTYLRDRYCVTPPPAHARAYPRSAGRSKSAPSANGPRPSNLHWGPYPTMTVPSSPRARTLMPPTRRFSLGATALRRSNPALRVSAPRSRPASFNRHRHPPSQTRLCSKQREPSSKAYWPTPKQRLIR
ncbi:PHP domain-containing protein [Bradyrhizobium icense]|uniref:PHP domain-containing protein n=1 Tax=Bradyrhizobium icense TaxID=1274631 RepID=UPI0018D3A131|nr:PHP domain-containing protein [Bradyrhizobium icense]